MSVTIAAPTSYAAPGDRTGRLATPTALIADGDSLEVRYLYGRDVSVWIKPAAGCTATVSASPTPPGEVAGGATPEWWEVGSYTDDSVIEIPVAAAMVKIDAAGGTCLAIVAEER